MKKKNLLFLVVCVLVAGTYFGYRYLYKNHRDIQSEVPSFELTALELRSSFQTVSNPEALNKTLIVHGTISEVDKESITLDESVHCVLMESPKGIESGAKVTIKGRCIGYDDLFEIVKLDQSQLINNP